MIISHLCLSDAYENWFDVAEVEPVEIGSIYERVIVPIQSGKVASARAGTGYTISGEIGNKRAAFSLYDEGVEIARLAVCMHSRASVPLFSQIADGTEFSGVTPQFLKLKVPWCVVSLTAPDHIMPDWLDALAKSLAASLIVHKIGINTA